MATLNEVATKITEIDAKQDKEIAVLTHKVEDLEKTVDEFRTRIRKNERWIAGAGAIITACRYDNRNCISIRSKGDQLWA